MRPKQLCCIDSIATELPSSSFSYDQLFCNRNYISYQHFGYIQDIYTTVVSRCTEIAKHDKEIKVSINGLKNLHDGLENDIINLLSEDSNNIINKYYDKVMEWWGKNIINKDDSKLKSTNIWTRFKKDNDDIVKELDANTFKDILCAFLPENDIIKAKGKSGALEINNIDWSEGAVIIVTTK